MGQNCNRDTNILNLIFVDNLRLHVANVNQIKSLLDQVKIFSNNIEINRGETKCMYVKVEKGLLIDKKEPIVMNIDATNLLRGDEFYKYQG